MTTSRCSASRCITRRSNRSRPIRTSTCSRRSASSRSSSIPRVDGKTDAAAQIAQLKKLAYAPPPLGPEASHALYTIAVLLHRPLGQDAEALRTLDMYHRRFAGGREMHAALWLRVRILCGHALDEDCRKAAYTYQHEVPTGPAADVAIRIMNAQ